MTAGARRTGGENIDHSGAGNGNSRRPLNQVLDFVHELVLRIRNLISVGEGHDDTRGHAAKLYDQLRTAVY